jgi:hypothetical protein
MIQEIAVLIEVLVFEECTPYDFVRKLSTQIHHVFQHLIVRLARKHDFTRVQFKQCHSNRPQINPKIV